MKKFAPLAVLFGLLGTLLPGAGPAQASVRPMGGSLVSICTNDSHGGHVVNCTLTDVLTDLVLATVSITADRDLNGDEIAILQNNLNNLTVPITVTKVNAVVVNTYNSFNPKVTIQNIKVDIL
jgi:hypothetical protein